MKLLRLAISISLLNFGFIAFTVYSVNSITAPRQDAQTERGPSASKNENLSSPTPLKTPSTTPKTVTKTPAKTVDTKKTALTTIKTPSPTSPSTPIVNKCIIIIDGNKYDVTDFRSVHKGGDIFKCSTDMTQVFYSQHDKSYLSKIGYMRVP